MEPSGENLRAVVEDGIPFLQKVVVKVEAIDPARVRLRFPYDRTNDNYVGLTHAGAIFTFGETCAGGAAGAAFDVARTRLLARRATIEYRRPVSGELAATVEISPDQAAAAEHAIGRDGTAIVPVSVVMVDAGGETVAEMTVEYHLRRIA
jgi:acyl-coenzyme A thioesterase PaaI-like protein